MKRYIVTSVLMSLVAILFIVHPERFGQGGAVSGQRPTRRPAAAPGTPAGTKDYSKFSHSTKEHTDGCKTCHKLPTANWQKVRDFPDVADFPGHDACVRCHRAQFFKGAQPTICSVCHTKTSPRDSARGLFRNPSRPRQFTIEFPHDRHQDVIAFLPAGPKSPKSFTRNSSLVKSAHAFDDLTKKYNNCEICHGASTKPAVAPPAGWTDNFVPAGDTFKASPDNHASCFNCHWSGREPTKDNCAGCHKLSPTPYFHLASPKRFSMKFRHDGGGEKKIHPAECTTCHINITKSATLKGLMPDVPIFPSCAQSSCHGPALVDEMSKFSKGNFKCSKCHTSDVGGRKPPNSHDQALLGQ
jgi:hypothetical protein